MANQNPQFVKQEFKVTFINYLNSGDVPLKAQDVEQAIYTAFCLAPDSDDPNGSTVMVIELSKKTI